MNKISNDENNIMSAQSGEQQYSHEAVRKQIESGINVGGPPVLTVQPLQATGCDPALATQVQEALDCAFIEQTLATGPLNSAMSAGEVVNELPFSCMIDLISGPYSNCDEDIPQNKRQAAYNAFVDVTGYKPVDLTKAFSTINNDFNTLVNFNAFYMFFPTLILLLIIIWLMVGFSWINWVIGLFFTVLVIVILYGFSILYRIHVQNYIRNQGRTLENEVNAAQKNLENSIPYWPQGLFAVACAITCTGGTGCWSCNERVCPPCPPAGTLSTRRARASSRATCGAQIIEPEEEEEEEEEEIKEPPKVTRKRRALRRRRVHVN